MYKKQHKNLCAIILSLGMVTSQVSCLHETTAELLAVGGGAAGGFGTALITYLLLRPAFERIGPDLRWHTSSENKTTKYIISGCTGVVGAGLVWYGLRECLQSLTPSGRCAAAQHVLSLVERDGLLTNHFRDRHEFISYLTMRFSSAYPLAQARDKLASMQSSAQGARSLLDQCVSEIAGNQSRFRLLQQCEVSDRHAEKLLQDIRRVMELVISDHDYPEQARRYERHLEEERQRAHERRLQEERIAHDRRERERDHAERRREKERDREMKQEAARRASRENVRINVEI